MKMVETFPAASKEHTKKFTKLTFFKKEKKAESVSETQR